MPEGLRINPFYDGRVSHRLRQRESVMFAGTLDPVPVPVNHKYFLYVGSGPAREGVVSSQLKKLNGWPIICIDLKIGGYDHDLTHEHTQRRVLELAALLH